MSFGIGADIRSNYGGGLNWDNEEAVAMPSSGGGAYVFFDALYAQVFAGFNIASGKFRSADVTYPYVLPTMSRTYLNIGVSVKYPISVVSSVKVFPLVALEYEPTLSAKITADGAEYLFDGSDVFGGYDDGYSAPYLNALWIKGGAGVDVNGAEGQRKINDGCYEADIVFYYAAYKCNCNGDV